MIDISVIVPCYNEEKTIGLLLRSLLDQTIPASEIEVVISDGMSTDDTRQVVSAFSQSYPELSVKVIDNPQRNIPSALNNAIKAAKGQYIIRLDAHSIPKPDYIERCIDHLNRHDGDNIGGVWLIEPGDQTITAAAIAKAASHPLGVGGVSYRSSSASSGLVDTVPFGAFRRSTFDEIGIFNENLLSNEDYELNARIRARGGKIYLDPEIQCTYFARSTFKALARQYWRYGYWKLRMLKRFPETIKPRQALPPLFILSLITLFIIALFFSPAWWLFFIEITVYLVILFASTLKTSRSLSPFLQSWFAMVLSICIMHWSWGTGFIWSFLTALF